MGISKKNAPRFRNVIQFNKTWLAVSTRQRVMWEHCWCSAFGVVVMVWRTDVSMDRRSHRSVDPWMTAWMFGAAITRWFPCGFTPIFWGKWSNLTVAYVSSWVAQPTTIEKTNKGCLGWFVVLNMGFVPLRKLTCPPGNSGWKCTFLLTWPLFRGHDSFLGV